MFCSHGYVRNNIHILTHNFAHSKISVKVRFIFGLCMLFFQNTPNLEEV